MINIANCSIRVFHWLFFWHIWLCLRTVTVCYIAHCYCLLYCTLLLYTGCVKETLKNYNHQTICLLMRCIIVNRTKLQLNSTNQSYYDVQVLECMLTTWKWTHSENSCLVWGRGGWVHSTTLFMLQYTIIILTLF